MDDHLIRKFLNRVYLLHFSCYFSFILQHVISTKLEPNPKKGAILTLSSIHCKFFFKEFWYFDIFTIYLDIFAIYYIKSHKTWICCPWYFGQELFIMDPRGKWNDLRERYGCTRSCILQELLIDMDALEAAPYKNSL